MFDNNKRQSSDEKQINLKLLGKKGLFLRDMVNVKVLMPPGFIIITTVFDKFMKETGLFSQIQNVIDTYRVSLNDQISLIQATNEIIKLINQTEFPSRLKKDILNEFAKLKTEYVAVRHSLLTDETFNVFLKKDFSTQLNISEKNLISAVKKAWASFFSPAAMPYRLKMKMGVDAPFSVLLIQKMVAASVSGVCYTINPLIDNNDQILIGARFGLSEKINTRGISRDTYIVDKKRWKILGKSVMIQKTMLSRGDFGTDEVEVGAAAQESQKLSDNQIVVLAKYVKRIEDFYQNKPQRVEWAMEKGKFYILNSQMFNQTFNKDGD